MGMKEIILLKSGELALKGQNRRSFEELLVKNCKARLRDLGEFKIHWSQSTTYVEPLSEDIDLDEAADRLCKVFGIAALTRAGVVEKDFARIAEFAPQYLARDLARAKTFKVESKRADKQFPMKSPEICAELGGILLEKFPHLRVNVRNPDVTVMVEIRESAAYVHMDQMPGAGGLPVGSSGTAMLLLSGGIDSPVAGYMMAKRGLAVHAVHFVSPPYTSDHALEKVRTLCKKMSAWCGSIRFHVVPFTDIQLAIREHCPEEYFTVIMRRYMMKLAEQVSHRIGAAGLITGESLAQVASQTLLALGCTDVACALPVLRPLIGMDKDEIVRIAYKIDTFETSILPYEDCCTVFTPRHPKTRPQLAQIEQAEALIPNADSLMEAALEGTTWEWIG